MPADARGDCAARLARMQSVVEHSVGMAASNMSSLSPG